MRSRRFKVPDVSGQRIRVSGDEADHALRVLRLKVGGEVVLFDGRGREVTGRVSSAERRAFEVDVTHRHEVDPSRGDSLFIAVAPPKGNRADWLVEKCAELGVRGLWLLRCDRGQVDPGEGKLQRWRRKGVEAAKQSGHLLTMAIEPARSLSDALAAAQDMCVCYGDPLGNAVPFDEVLRSSSSDDEQSSALLVFIGPEGGFSDAEVAALQNAGAQAMRLSNAILRVETAAVAAASVWAAWATGNRGK